MPRKAAAPRAATPRKRTPAPRKTTTPRKVAAPAKKTAAKKAAPAKRTTTPRKATPRKAAPRKATALRVVGPDERPAPDIPTTLVDAAKQGNERAMLVFLRAKLAETISASTTPARDQASLSIRLLQINRDIQLFDARAAEEAKQGDDEDVDETFDPEAL